MVFLPGLAQIFQFCEIFERALDLGWTEMLIPLPFHGQSSTECVEQCLPSQQCLPKLGSTHWDKTRASMILMLSRNLQHL